MFPFSMVKDGQGPQACLTNLMLVLQVLAAALPPAGFLKGANFKKRGIVA